MILRLRYRRGGLPVDLEVSLPPDTTTGELAGQLVALDPKPRRFDQAPDCIAVGSGPGQVVVDAGTTILGSPIVSGADVEVVRGHTPGAGAGRVPKVAELTVIGGPDTGRIFPLRRGTYTIGRDASSDIQIHDDTVSKSHAKVIVGDGVEIVDNNSSNGVVLAGVSVARATVRSTDAIDLGDSTVLIAMLDRAAQGPTQAPGAHDFVRSPRISPVFAPQEMTAPDIPGIPDAQKLSIVMLVTPLLMGAVLFAVTKSAASLLFVAMTPVMGIGQWLESRLGRRRNVARTTAQFRADLAAFGDELRARQELERRSRLLETPGGADVGTAIAARSDLLWCRRREDEQFLHLRLGLGADRSRVTIVEPTGNRNEALQRSLRSLVEEVALLPGVPIVADLRTSAIGVAGPGEASLAAARSLVLQVAGLHAPEDVTIAACMSSQSEAEWDWLKWLPHAAGAASPIKGPTIAAGPGATAKLVEAVEELMATRVESLGSEAEVHHGPALVLLVEDDAPIDRARLVALAAGGPRCGVHVIWHAGSRRALPAACRSFVEMDTAGVASAGFVEEAVQVQPLAVEQVQLADVTRHARLLAPVVDAGSLLQDDSDLPTAVSFLSLSDPELARTATAVADRWRESDSLARHRPPGTRRKAGTLRALLGQASGGPLTLDLRSDGPHALVGGTTGSGKSELLQTWVVALAAAHSPERVTFLFVDYKGGSAFGECVELPHSVGLVTDLSPHLVHRALESLNAEVRHREHLLQRARAKDLQDMERSGHPDTPPSLVIVVDEFAALIHEVPEFVDGVVNVAQRGRSLGLHLILATQRPAGVIKDNLRANTNLRLALRMADEEDSTDVLGTTLAAGFDPAAPGRAAVRRGPGRLTTFQAAYVGGVTDDSGPKRQIAISELSPIDPVPWVAAEAPDTGAVDQASDLKRILQTITAAARLEEVPEPRKPWLPELPAALELVDLAKRDAQWTDSRLVFALQDEPETQSQSVCTFNPDVDGNLAIFGAGGSGKSATLRTLALAGALTERGGPVHVFGLDFGARGLQMLEPLPHVGAVIPGEDDERVARCLRDLRALLVERSERYARANATTITDFRQRAEQPLEPRILVLIDGFPAFRQAHDTGATGGLMEVLTSIAADGRPVGIHVVLTADRPAALPSSMSSLISRRLALRLSDETDLTTLNVPRDMFTLKSPPGRGYLDGHEVQVAVLGADPSGAAQAAAIAKMAQSLRLHSARPSAPTVRRLPDDLPASSLPAVWNGEPVIGMEDSRLGPATIKPEGSFVIVGPPTSGRSTALASVVRAVVAARPGTRCVLFTPNKSASAHADWDLVVAGAEQAAEHAEQLAGTLESAGLGGPRWVIALESAADFLGSPADAALTELLRVARSNEHFIVGEGETQSMSQGWPPLLQALRFNRCGIAMQPDQNDGDSIFKTMFPRVRRADFPRGRGMLVRDGHCSRVQVAWAGADAALVG